MGRGRAISRKGPVERDYLHIGEQWRKEKRTMKKGDVARKAAELVEGDRDEAYGDALKEFGRISAVFEELTGHCITPEDMALLFICMKLVRDSFRAKEDNMVDVCGYASIRACIREQQSDEDEKE